MFSSRAAARRRGIADHRPILARTRRNIGIAIQKRLVDQVRGCLPHSDSALDGVIADLDGAILE